eukprot:GEMP01001117.1.p1 GENE.GEMP01001117.1~~GEMP01001117.1.p1  ORF type:complete len:686 (+),score=165.95 GEMP01001117.1:31-2088(+)
MTFREPEGKSDDYSYARAKEQRIADAYATWKQASRAYQKDHTADVEREDREHRWSKSKTVRRDDDFTPSKRSSFKRETPPKQQSHRKKFSLVLRERSHSRSRPRRRGYEYGVDNSTTNAAAQRRDCSENGGEEPQYYPRGGVDSAHLPRKRESSRYYRQIAKQEMGDGGDGYYRRDEKLSGDEKYRALEEKSYARQPNIQESSLERQGPTRRQSRSIHDDPRDPQTHTLDALADRQNAPYHKRERCTGDYSRDYDDDLRHRDRTIRRPRSLPYYRDGREQQQYTGVDGADGRIGYDGNDGCGSIAIRRTPSTAVVANGWLHERRRQRSRPRSRSQGPPRQARHAEVSPETLYESERRRERPRRKELVDARDMRGIRDVRYSDGGEERQRDANRKDASGRRLDVELKTDNRSRRAANAYVNFESSSSSASSASDDDDDECDDISIPETSQERDPVMRSAAVPRVKPPRSAQSPSLSPSSCPSPSPSSSPSSSQSAKAPVQGKRRAAERVNRPVLAVKQRGSIISKSAVVRDRERPETNHKHLEGESDTRCPPSPRMASPYPPSPDDFELVDNMDSFDDLSVADSASGVRTPDFSPVYLAIACGNAEEIDAGVPIEDTIIADGKLLSPWIPDGLQRMYKQCVALENHSLVLVPTEDHVVEAKQWFSGKTDGPRSLTVFDLTTMTRIL